MKPSELLSINLYSNKLKNESFDSSEPSESRKDPLAPKTNFSGYLDIVAGARNSLLSKAQLREVQAALQEHYPEMRIQGLLIETQGDKDQQTSLRILGKTDFFTREIDSLLLAGACRIAIHSAKDLPEPLPTGLVLIALTKCLNPHDALVMRHGEYVHTLKKGALIATSSEKREAAVRKLRTDVSFRDVRGTIAQRLALLDQGQADGVVVAEAALIRLMLTHLNRIILPGETTLHQGRLAILARQEDREMRDLFACLHLP